MWCLLLLHSFIAGLRLLMLASSCSTEINGVGKKFALGWDNVFQRMLVPCVMVHPAEPPAYAKHMPAQVESAYGCPTGGEPYASNHSHQSVTIIAT